MIFAFHFFKKSPKFFQIPKNKLQNYKFYIQNWDFKIFLENLMKVNLIKNVLQIYLSLKNVLFMLILEFQISIFDVQRFLYAKTFN